MATVMVLVHWFAVPPLDPDGTPELHVERRRLATSGGLASKRANFGKRSTRSERKAFYWQTTR